MIVLLTEEESMKQYLEVLIPKLWPGSTEGMDWMVLSFQGKSDLERSIPKKMANWSCRNPHFIILRDNDGGNCFTIKQKLRTIANPSKKSFHVRIVCQQLESWLLGDLGAVKLAYPGVTVRKRAKFREPDQLTNASQELEKLVHERAKILRAKKIGEHSDFEKNTSQSFNVFVKTLRQLIRTCEGLMEAGR